MLAPDTDPASLAGLEIVDRNGERIGRVRQVYPDGGDLGWAGVRGNLIGTTEALVPLDRARLEDDVITVPITRARFLAAPRRTPDSTMDEEERTLLRGFYDDADGTAADEAPAAGSPVDAAPADSAGRATGPVAVAPPVGPGDEPDAAQPLAADPIAEQPAAPEGVPAPRSATARRNALPVPVPEDEPVPQPVRADRHAGVVPADEPVVPAAAPEAAPRSDQPAASIAAAPDSAPESGLDTGIDRSEQRIHVTTEPVPRTRVVLRKVVITEQRTITVPVRREEIRMVREPIEDGRPVSDSVFSDAEEEYVLHEERVVVRTEVVPVERIRLVREVLQEQREVTGETWREQIVAGEEPV